MSTKNNETKKSYTKPTVTDHGKLTEETKGITGTSWEIFGHQPADESGGKGN